MYALSIHRHISVSKNHLESREEKCVSLFRKSQYSYLLCVILLFSALLAPNIFTFKPLDTIDLHWCIYNKKNNLLRINPHRVQMICPKSPLWVVVSVSAVLLLLSQLLGHGLGCSVLAVNNLRRWASVQGSNTRTTTRTRLMVSSYLLTETQTVGKGSEAHCQEYDFNLGWSRCYEQGFSDSCTVIFQKLPS